MINANQPDAATPLPVAHHIGRVTHLFPDGSLSVECAQRGWHCQRAASCLLTPGVGDRVLLTAVQQEIWLLAVLERAQPQQVAQLSTTSALQIASAAELSLSSPRLSVTAKEGDCHIDALKYSGASLSAWVSISTLMGKRCESVWQTLTQISHNVFRRTRQAEQVYVGQLEIKAENYLQLHGKNTLISAQAITRVDGGQIHMG